MKKSDNCLLSAVEELKEYFEEKGIKFINYATPQDINSAVCSDYKEFCKDKEESLEKFISQSYRYLYDLAFLRTLPWPRREFAFTKQVLQNLQVKEILDFGCGVGSVGMELMKFGYTIYFSDICKPALDFLKWRLKRRELSSNVYHLYSDSLPKVECVLSLEVFDHIPRHNYAKTIKYVLSNTEKYFVMSRGWHSNSVYFMFNDVTKEESAKIIQDNGFERIKVVKQPYAPQVYKRI